MKVGKLLGDHIPVHSGALQRLELIADKIGRGEIDSLTQSTWDKRFKIDEWKLAISKELLAVYSWGLRRLLYNSMRTASDEIESCHSVVCFQPRYGIALHTLRRVVPFAMLNLPCVCIYRDELKSEARRVNNAITSLLSLRKLSVKSLSDLSSVKVDSKVLIVFTGRAQNLRRVRLRYPFARIVGCTGSKSVVVADTMLEGKKLTSSSRIIRPSCTNIGAILVARDDKKVWDPKKRELMNVGKMLTTYNPTIVYNHSSRVKNFTLEQMGHFVTSTFNISSVGPCADPLNDYPGDFLF